MNIVDFSFFYKHSARNLLLLKYFNVKNSYGIPKISKLCYSFLLLNVMDIDDIQVYNYIYLFKYFFGRNSFITRIKSTFYLGIWYYTFKVSMIISDREIYFNLFFLINEFVKKADKTNVWSGIFNKFTKIFYIMIKDLNVFSEKKTNLGLFCLWSDLNIYIYCQGVDFLSTKYLFNNLKIKIC